MPTPNYRSELFRADLHCHTTCSDGTLSPKEIILAAIKHNLQALSITDHDTIQAYREALPIAAQLNFKLLSGIELSAHEANQTVHVLGYGINLQAPQLWQHSENIIQNRKIRNLEILEKLKKYNINIHYDELTTNFPNRIIGRVHIAKIMLNKGYVKNLKTAFNNYLGDKGRCVVPLKALSVSEAIQLIHEAGGKAVLAHPHRIKSRKRLNNIVEAPFDGIETYYALSTKNDEQKIASIAKEKGWFVTGGSDFHGSSHPYIKLGCSWTTQEVFSDLYKIFITNNERLLNNHQSLALS